MKAKIMVLAAALLVLGACSEESRQQAQQTLDQATEKSKELIDSAKQQAQEASDAVAEKSQQLYEEGKQKLGEQQQ